MNKGEGFMKLSSKLQSEIEISFSNNRVEINSICFKVSKWLPPNYKVTQKVDLILVNVTQIPLQLSNIVNLARTEFYKRNLTDDPIPYVR
jgi:hypothetical protein